MDLKLQIPFDAGTPHEVAAQIRHLGYEPVWKDWDAALTM